MANITTDTIINNYDQFTSEVFNTRVLPVNKPNGSPYTDADVDNAITFKNPSSLGGGYSRRAYTSNINVEWFGGKADAVDTGGGAFSGTDSTAAIIKAINFASGKYPVVLPPGGGVWAITNVINITIPNTQIILYNTTVQQFTQLKSLFIFKANNCSIIGNGTVIGTGTGDESSFSSGGGSKTDSYGAGITFDRVDGGYCMGIIARNCGGTVSRIGAGFYITSAKNIVVEKTKAFDCSTAVNTDSIFSESFSNKILHNYWNNCYNGYVGDYTGSHRNNSVGDTVFDCIAENCGNTGFQVDTCPTRWFLIDCRAITCANNGFAFIHSVQSGTVRGLRATGCNIGAVINGVDGSTPAKISFSDCYFQNNVQDGMQLWTCVDISLQNCFMTGNGRYGLLSPSHTFPKRVNIQGGSYSDNHGDGMFINDPSGLRIFNATVKGNRTDATTYPDGSGITIRQVDLIPTDILINGVSFYDLNSTPPSSQKYGFYLNTTNANSVKLEGNYYGTQTTAQVFSAGGSALIDRLFDNSDTGIDFNNNIYLGGGINTRSLYRTTNYTITSTDSRIVSDGASLTHTLPDITGLSDGFEIEISNVNNTNVAVRALAGNIQGAAFIYVNYQESKVFIFKNSLWYVKNNDANIGSADLHAIAGNKLFISGSAPINAPYSGGRFQGLNLIPNNDPAFTNQIDIDLNGNVYIQNQNGGVWAPPESIRAIKYNTGTTGLSLFSGSKNLSVICNQGVDFTMTLISDTATLAGQYKDFYNRGTASVFITVNSGITVDGVVSTGTMLISLKPQEWIKLISIGVDNYVTHYKYIKPLEKNLTTSFDFTDSNLNSIYPAAIRGFEVDFPSITTLAGTNVAARAVKLDDSSSGSWLIYYKSAPRIPNSSTTDVVTLSLLNTNYPIAKYPVGTIVSYFNQGMQYTREDSTNWTQIPNQLVV